MRVTRTRLQATPAIWAITKNPMSHNRRLPCPLASSEDPSLWASPHSCSVLPARRLPVPIPVRTGGEATSGSSLASGEITTLAVPSTSVQSATLRDTGWSHSAGTSSDRTDGTIHASVSRSTSAPIATAIDAASRTLQNSIPTISTCVLSSAVRDETGVFGVLQHPARATALELFDRIAGLRGSSSALDPPGVRLTRGPLSALEGTTPIYEPGRVL